MDNHDTYQFKAWDKQFSVMCGNFVKHMMGGKGKNTCL